jgi:predicted NBD/HSP70 family sugar kinase
MLCVYFANIINVFNLEIVLIGGEISGRGKEIISIIKKRIHNIVYRKRLNTEIKLNKYKK